MSQHWRAAQARAEERSRSWRWKCFGTASENVFGCLEDQTKAQQSGSTDRKGAHRFDYYHGAYVRSFDNDHDSISQQNSKILRLPKYITSVWSSHPFAQPEMQDRLRRNRSS